MTRRVLVFDTSVICCLLSVPNKETAGPRDDLWDQARVDALIEKERDAGSTFVLPTATIIETGNHIAQAPRDRFEVAGRFARLIAAAAQAETPWAAFADQATLWGGDRLIKLAEAWPTLAAGGTTIGDATIKDVAEHYSQAGFAVEIVTGDAGLKAYEPAVAIEAPRRRGGRT